MTLDGIEIVASAYVERGKKSNRIRVRKQKRPRPAPVAKPPRAKRPKPVKAPRVKAAAPPRRKRYELDRTVRGKGHRVLCFSIPPDEMVELDTFADRVQMARSHVIRQAVKHFIAWVFP